MSDEQKPAPTPAPEFEEEELEYRPFVKYAGIGLAVLLVLGSGYATYALGYRQGFESGISSGQVESSINNAAVQSISHLMQAGVAHDEELVRMAADTEKALSWIHDTGVRQEAEWTLACALLQRHMADKATPLLKKLFSAAPTNVLWARRASMAADYLQICGQDKTAAQYYRRAADTARKCSSVPEYANALENLSAALLSSGAKGDRINGQLNEILREAEALADAGLTCRSLILAYEGERLRDNGQTADAQRCFESLMKLLPNDYGKLSPTALICFGLAAKETGHPEQARELLERGLQFPGVSLRDSLCRLSALRHLASLAQENNDAPTALDLLNQAEGLALGRVGAGDAFWNCLFVQKGWVLFENGRKAAAAEQFRRALHNNPVPAAAVQALEGAGRCALDSNAEEASKLLSDCIQLRLKHFAGDIASLGRLTLLHAHARDAVNMPEQAAELYAKAAEYLLGDAPELKENRRMALLGHAYALFRAEKWEEALTAWEKVLPLLEDKPELREDAINRLQDCRGRLNQKDPDFTSDISS